MSSSLKSNRRATHVLLAVVFTCLFALYTLRKGFLEESPQFLDITTSQRPPAKNVAVIVEDRPLSNLPALLLHFLSVLGPDWPIVFYTTAESQPNSTAFLRAVNEGHISIRSLPSDLELDQRPSITQFLTRPWFWEQLAPAQHVLLFQADSIVCANSNEQLESFLEYDFVGAPIDTKGHGEGYNGGFSLRNRSLILDIVTKHSWQTEKDTGLITNEPCQTTKPCLKFEDQWFYHKMKDTPGVRLPSQEVASHFSVETIWYDTPLGHHQVGRWNAARMDEVASWCPEVKMTMGTELLTTHKRNST